MPAAEMLAAGSQSGVLEVVEVLVLMLVLVLVLVLLLLHGGRVRDDGEHLVAIEFVVGAAASYRLARVLVGVGLEVRVIAGALG